MNEPQTAGARTRPPGPPAVVWSLAFVFVAFEAAFMLAEALDPRATLRWEVYQALAFFDFIFEAALRGVDVPATLYASFATHALLHGGMLHLLMNCAIFLGLGGVLANAIGATRFMVLFFGSAIGGALVFGLLADASGPLVGASGGIFGFFGALKRWEWRWVRATGASPRRFYGTVSALILINVALAFMAPGGASVAWEAHLGGFLAGWLLAPVLAPGRAGPSPI